MKPQSPSSAPALLAAALMGVLLLAACGSEPAVGGATSAVQERTAPGLGGLKKQANRLLDGGPRAFKARLAELKGPPRRGQPVGLMVWSVPLRVPVKLSYTHVGGYASEAGLQAEIERYAIDD